MFSRLRNKKPATRKDRPKSRGSADTKTQESQGDGTTSILDGDAHIVRPTTSDSRSSFAASTAPTLPPIPRVASQVDRSPTTPQFSSINDVVEAQESSRDGSATPSPVNEADADPVVTVGSRLEPVSSIDRTKAELRADKNQMDALPMPQQVKRSKPRMAINRPPLRSWTDFQPHPVPTEVREEESGKESPNTYQVPTPYRLEEPKDYISSSLDPEAYTHSNRPRSRLTRLNPLSYLSRKRSSQVPIEGVDDSALLKRASYHPFKDVSDSYDPRIIGARVHDFSAPMPSQYVSVQDLRSLAAEPLPPSIYLDPRRGSDSNLPDPSDVEGSPERRHLPVFKEDFGESADGWRLDPKDRRNQVTTDIVDKVAALEEVGRSGKRKSTLPAFAQGMPQDLPEEPSSSLLATPTPNKLSPRPPSISNLLDTPNSIQRTPDSLKPPKDRLGGDRSPAASPLLDRSQATSPEASDTLSSLPRHLRSKTASVKSTASRFSFDMGGSGSAAQEKMLEEKHRQRSAQRARATSITGASINEEDDFDEEDYDFDDEEDDDEDFPGSNVDEFSFNFIQGGVSSMTLDDLRPAAPLDSQGENGQSADRGDQTSTIEHPNEASSGSPSRFPAIPKQGSPTVPLAGEGQALGLGLQTPLVKTSKDAPSKPLLGLPVQDETAQARQLDRIELSMDNLNSDAFYFDDGEFDGEFDDDVIHEGEQFDESLLDQNFSRGKPLTSLNTRPYEENDDVVLEESSTRSPSSGSDQAGGDRHSGLISETNRTSLQERRSSAYGQHTEAEAAAQLTHKNLYEFHEALAQHANKANLEGRFKRSPNGNAAQDGLRQEPTQTQRQMMPPPTFVPGQDAEDFDFDDAMNDDDDDDDLIIAAANAEALENDDDGFYGQEFGFYAQSNGSSEVTAFHGGFFGSSQVKRSHSSRVDFPEPSLTPITERSEWSNRNSMISLSNKNLLPPGTGPSAAGLGKQAPGLAQLADQMQLEGNMDDMTLGALMRARRNVFGGSSTSLHSMGTGGSRSASPTQYMSSQPTVTSPLGNSGPGYPTSGNDDGFFPQHYRTGSNPSARPSSMLSLQTQNLALRPTTSGSGSDSSPLKRSSLPARDRISYGHSHNNSGSGAESAGCATDKELVVGSVGSVGSVVSIGGGPGVSGEQYSSLGHNEARARHMTNG